MVSQLLQFEDVLVNGTVKVKTLLTRPGYHAKKEVKHLHVFLNQ